MAVVLQLMAQTGKKLSELVAEIPRYTMIKQKFDCAHERIERMLAAVRERFAHEQVNDADGVRIDWPEGWVHIRGSNTEPIARVIAEAHDEATARQLIATARDVADAVQ